MPFSPEVKTSMFVRCMRHCCLCRKQCGTNIEAAHIIDEAAGGSNNEDNGIPLCFDCHQEAGAYRDSHPKGNKFRPEELRQRRDAVYELVRTGNINKQQPHQSHATVFNVNSYGQQGGITAAVVNHAPQPRKIDEVHKAQLLQLLPDKSKGVTIQTVLGDAEAVGFATQLRDFLESHGYQVNFSQGVCRDILPEQRLDPETRTLIIGSRK